MLINLENKLANINFLLIEKKIAISLEKRLYYNSEAMNVLTIQAKSQEKDWNENCLFNRGWAGISNKVALSSEHYLKPTANYYYGKICSGFYCL